MGATDRLIIDDAPRDEPWYGTDGMCNAGGIDPPNFPDSIDQMVKPENAVEMIHKLVMKVSFVAYLKSFFSYFIFFLFSDPRKCQ